MRETGRTLPLAGLIHLGVVYVVWSSTYLAIRVAVRPASGFPPFMMCMSRMAAAGALLMGVAWWRRERLAPTRDELGSLAVSGVVLWVGGNGLMVWAAQTSHSGFTALMAASAPIWVALIELALFRKLPGAILLGSLALGFGGLGVLMAPTLGHGHGVASAGGVFALAGAFFWALGSVYQRRNTVDLSGTAAAAYQSLFGGAGFLLVSRLLHEPLPTPTANAWVAWVYLVIFGALAFVSFVSALRLLPINVTMTYAYVNPVLAVLLGWWWLGEPVTWWTLGGAALVIISVVGIFREKYTGQ